ncbi:uncharacterized protein LOC132896276 isoform X2 [Neoarius graeffei]|uniref:uncharacterized protein LOC132896276 isoform X2 n=1 Tax=Neoarius graeffei TaxID=443677 RepID=UPI00298C5ABB|nr:uncharacterized protein LOC132896276 isoform X2 [Neoarius graeffei]
MKILLIVTLSLISVLIRKLKPQDAGTYRFGLGNQSNSTVNLKVLKNASWGVPKIMNAYLGQNITITCNYPGEYERNNKYISTVDDDNIIKRILDTNTNLKNGRFSISDDRNAKVLRVNISDVRETDEVFYLLGVWIGDGSVRYYSYFIEMWLHVTGVSAPTETPVCFSSTAIIISVCVSVCVYLLLIGGFALVSYKLRQKRTQDSVPSSKRNENKQVPSVSENVMASVPPCENLNIIMRFNHQKPESFTGQSDSTYQTLDPLTIQSDSDYTSLINTTEQLPMSSHYQCLNPRTRTNSVYHTLHS